MDSQPTPRLQPVRYWPASDSRPADLGLFANRRQRRRTIAGWVLAVGSFAVFAGFATSVALRQPSVAFQALAPLILPAVIAAAVIYVIVRPDPGAPAGVWEVDEAGLPVRFVSTKPSPELSDEPGVDLSGFQAATRARAGH